MFVQGKVHAENWVGQALLRDEFGTIGVPTIVRIRTGELLI